MKLDIINFIFLVTYSAKIYAADDFSKIEFKAKQLTKSVYMLEGAGGNITALIGPDGVLLVDDDFAEMSDKLVTKLKELGGNSPRFIINSHFHYDHTGGNEKFGSSATIIAATSVRDRLSSEQILWRQKHPAAKAIALPIITFDQSLILHFNNENIRILHLADGHTDGDTIVFFLKNKVISMGDLFFSGMYPIFHPEHKGSLQGYIHDIELVLNLAPVDALIIPGHGPINTRTDLQKYYEMLIDSVAIVKNGIKKGQSLEQIQKIGLPSKWDSFSHGYLSTDKWIDLIYKNLSSEVNNVH